MKSGRGRTRCVAAAFAVATSAVLTGCAAPVPDSTQIEAAAAPDLPIEALSTPTPEPVFEVPDITARTVTPDDLAAMLPGEPSQVSVRSNEHLLMASILDRSDQADDIVASGRTTGIAATYERSGGSGFVWIDVLDDPAAAHAYLVDLTGDIAKGVDGTHAPEASISEPIEFAASAGEEAVGLIGTLPGGETETLIVARVGRLVVFASESRSDTSDQRVQVQYLVDDTVTNIVDVLTGDQIDLTALLDPSYRFQTTIEVNTPDERWNSEISGTVEPGALDCTVARSTPTRSLSLEVIVIDDHRWFDDGTRRGFVNASANAAAGEALAWCPAWPLRTGAAGLTELASLPDPARHHLNGVDAAGYQGDREGLAAALGLESGSITLETFSFWVADGTDFVIELALIVSGPADRLTSLIGSEFAAAGEVTVSLRHRVFDLDAVDTVVAPN